MPRHPARNLALIVLGLGLAIAMFFTWATGEVYEAVTNRDGVSVVDQPILDWVLTWRTTAEARAITYFTDLGGPVIMPVIALVGALAVAAWWRSVAPVIIVAVAAAGSLAMTVVSKPLLGRARPPQADAVAPFESSASFPSGHALNATVIVGVLLYLVLLRRRGWLGIGIVLFGGLFVVAIGLSRVVLGHHWFTDVLAGWLIGLGWLFVVITGHRLALVPGFARARFLTPDVVEPRSDGHKPASTGHGRSRRTVGPSNSPTGEG